MEPSGDKPRLAIIAGPTAAGKSAYALAFAEAHGGTIINADASQVYADLQILSARPVAADLARVPHELYGILDGGEACDAARWAGLARAAIDAAWSAGRLPVVVGGTGLYLRTLLDGIAPVPPIDPAVRAAVRLLVDPHEALLRDDPAAATRLVAADRQRAARSLEVFRSTGRSLLDWQTERSGGLAGSVALTAMVVDRLRAELYSRIDRRLDAMLEAGAMSEIAALEERHLPADRPVMKALGVPRFLAAWRGETPLAEAVALTRLDTKRYAKRQQTWFRNQHPEWTRVSPMPSTSGSDG